MSEKCACETLKGTQCSFNRKAPEKYCGKHIPCKKDWGQMDAPKPIVHQKASPKPIIQQPHQIKKSSPKPIHSGRVERLDVGCAAINKSNGLPCIHLAKPGNIYCGIHIKALDVSLSQAEIPVVSRKVAPATYNVKKIKPDGRLSARLYWDTYPESLGDRCDIRKDNNYNCLLVDSAGRPKWFPKSSKGSELQKPCGDFSPRCKDPEFN